MSFSIPASKKVVYLRSCEVHQFSENKIIKSYMLLDFKFDEPSWLVANFTFSWN